MSREKPKPFEPGSLFPGKTDQEVAEVLAAHFNSVSSEFSPLEPCDLPETFNEELPRLEVWQVAIRVKRFRKPKSMVACDLFPSMVTKYADFLAVPLTAIYNEITVTGVWPYSWKREAVTVIPKTKIPSEIGHLRNISCTLLISKIYESFVLGLSLIHI